MSPIIKVLIADEHPLVRYGIRATLSMTSDIDVVAETDTTHNLLSLCQTNQPAIILVEVHLPGPTLASTIANLRLHCPTSAIVVVSGDIDTTALRAARQGDIAGYILKAEAIEVLAVAIRSVAGGEPWYSNAVCQQLAAADASAAIAQHGLTDLEVMILEGIVQGLSSGAIGRTLNLKEQTVRNYTSRIFNKIQVPSRAVAALWALAHGFRGQRSAG